jgi:hypothetical protein
VAAAVELATAARDEAARALAELGRTRVGVRRYGGALRPLATTHQRVARRA